MSYIFDTTKNYTEDVFKTYHKALIDIDTQVYNAMADSMHKLGATEFSNGWLAATIWMADRYGYKENEWVDDNLEAKTKEIKERFFISYDGEDE